MRIPLLLWVMFILFMDSLALLILGSAFFLLPLSLIDAWVSGSEIRWLVTGVATAAGLVLWLGRSRFVFRTKAKVLLLALALLVFISILASGNGNAGSFRVAYQDTNRLAYALLFFSMLAVSWTSWSLTEYWPGVLRGLWVGAIGLAALPFLALFFRDAAFVPFAGFAAFPVLLESACLMAGFAYVTLRYYRPQRGEPPLLRERWFEFGLVTIAVALSASTLLK